MEGNNDDEEPQICTVFSSTPSSTQKTIFDTIAFSVPKKENSVLSPTSPFSEEEPEAPVPRSSSSAKLEQDNGAAETLESLPASSMFESLSMSYMSPSPFGTTPISTPIRGGGDGGGVPVSSFAEPPVIGQALNEESLRLVSKEIESLSLSTADTSSPQKRPETDEPEEEQSPLPTANQLFSNAPEVPFPVGATAPPPSILGTTQPPQQLDPPPSFPSGVPTVKPIDAFSSITYSTKDAAYDAWIPNEATRQILMSIATSVHSGTYFPDKANMTTPGVIYKEDLVDKVAVNMSRIFGEQEATKRQILTADSVTQDDKGIRELVKLGCYRSAINLTKRLLTLYGQGPGKIGHFSKHTPDSIQLWFTRIALLVRIREFKIAESELEAFGDFENPDMYYDYYQDNYGQGRKGSMVPFHFRLLAAEIPQYASKNYSATTNKLAKILQTIQKILANIEEGISEDGSSVTLDEERREFSRGIWRKREIRVYYSLTNAFLLSKDFPNVLKYLTLLRDKESPERKAQLTSAIGRLFLQYGDLPTAQKYFKEAAALRSTETESERVENLVDAALYFIAQGVYAEAFGLLKEALVIQPDNFMITNNMAVCLLYMGKVKESLTLMESTVQNNKPQLLQENVILNLSTIYELENSDGSKKNGLLKLISEYKGDGINLASLKMPNLI